MPVNPEKKEEPKVEVLPLETPQEPEKIQIDDAGKPLETPNPVAQSVSPDEIRKIQARLEYQARQYERQQNQLLAEIQRLKSPVSQPEKPAVKDDEFDPNLDVIARENWQKGVGILAEKKAEAIAEKKFKALMEEREKLNQVNFQRQQTAQQLEREKAWVLEKTPSLNDETSEEFKGYYATYTKMLSDDPSLASNPRAPRLIWYEWKSSEKEKPTQNIEAERLKRVTAAAVPQGRQISTKKTYQLTQAEIDWCQKHKISPAEYAKNKEANLKEGITA